MPEVWHIDLSVSKRWAREFAQDVYFDRISEATVSLRRKDFTCPNGHLLGVKITYEKEKRPAFRLFVDSVVKKTIKV